jgi:hypothetical protein
MVAHPIYLNHKRMHHTHTHTRHLHEPPATCITTKKKKTETREKNYKNRQYGKIRKEIPNQRKQ